MVVPGVSRSVRPRCETASRFHHSMKLFAHFTPPAEPCNAIPPLPMPAEQRPRRRVAPSDVIVFSQHRQSVDRYNTLE